DPAGQREGRRDHRDRGPAHRAGRAAGVTGMDGRHTVLLVEDEPQMAEELGELLESLGHGHVHAATKEDAVRLVEEGGFCYVLLDLQIKANADSIKAHVEAGQSLLELIRERYPRRNDEGKHRLQILVMSGHAKEHYFVVKAL